MRVTLQTRVFDYYMSPGVTLLRPQKERPGNQSHVRTTDGTGHHRSLHAGMYVILQYKSVRGGQFLAAVDLLQWDYQ